MHPLFAKADTSMEQIIAAAIELHRDEGPGLINFNSPRLTTGIARLILTGANL